MHQNLREALIPNPTSDSGSNQGGQSKPQVNRNSNLEISSKNRRSANRGRGWYRASENVSRFSAILDLDMDLPEDVMEDEAAQDTDHGTMELGNRNMRNFSHNVAPPPSSKRVSYNNNMSADRVSSFSYMSSNNTSSLADSTSLEL
jgi:hypothetical protein